MKIKMKKLRRFLDIDWQPVMAYWLAALFLASLLLFELSTLVQGVADAEAAAIAQSATVQGLMQNPLYGPHKLLQLVAHALGRDGILAMRAVSALIAAAVVLMFYQVLRNWYSLRVAILGTFLLATSSWFLHVARYASPEITHGLLIALVWCGLQLRLHPNKRLVSIVVAIIIVALCYTPGMLWFLIPGIVWQFPTFGKEFTKTPIWTGLVMTLTLVLLVPLVLGLVQSPELIKPLLGLPDTFASPMQMLKNTLFIPRQLFMTGIQDPSRWLPGTPLLDVFSGAMLVLGLYTAYHMLRLDRVRLTLAVLFISTALVAVGGPVTITVLLPFIYLLVALGVAFMLEQWFAIFPRNPVARSVGTTLMSVTVLVTASYNLQHYFIAWPNAPDTKQAFHQRSDTIRR